MSSLIRSIARRLLPVRHRNALKSLAILERGMGHSLSSRTQRPVDAAGNPIPWYSYPAIEFLARIDFSTKNVFEFGSGNSTLWWSARSRSVTSVERDDAWYRTVAQMNPGQNSTISHAPTRDAYLEALCGEYDVIVVDGDWRGACAERAIAHVARDGIILVDNSDWYPGICELLRTHDLIEVDFSGFGPINPYTSTTSVFLRPEFRASQLPYVPIGSIKPFPPVTDDWPNQ